MSAYVEKTLLFGRMQRFQGQQGESTIVRTELFQIIYSTPASLASGAPAPYGIDIWEIGPGKVFSVYWDPIQLIRLDYGAWINEFDPGSFVEPHRVQ
jgi:hypothetical protein